MYQVGPANGWVPQGASWSIHTAFVMRLYLGFLQYCYRSTQQCTAAEIALARCAGQLGDGMSLGRCWKKASSCLRCAKFGMEVEDTTCCHIFFNGAMANIW